MKKLFVSVIATLTVVMFPATALASNGQLVSGPSGTQVNGWYSSNPTIRVNTVPNCPSGPSGNINMIIINEEGQHRITLRSHLNGYPRIYRDDDVNGRGTTGEVFSCPSIDTPYTGDDPTVFWQGDIKYDATAPTISISSPTNNSNTEGSSIQVTGSVGDNLSGVWTVVVNGVNASVSGGSFSASVPLSVGLNTINATVKDYAGNSKSAGPIVVNRNATNNSSNNSKPSAGTTSNNQSSNNSSSSGDNTSKNQASQDVNSTSPGDENNDESPTLVKGVVQGGGIGIASILAFVIVLLLLDKFRIIEVKAFSQISDKFSKNKTAKKKTSAKKSS